VLCWHFIINASNAQSITPKRITYEILLNNNRFEGMPLAWNKQHVFMLARDGAMFNFEPGKEQSFQKKSSTFEAFNVTTMKSRIAEEFGSKFDVHTTPHFLIVTQTGKNGAWAERFEEMYKSFWTYFQVRGFQLVEPEFPMVATIWDSQQAFLRNADREEIKINNEILGYYLSGNNRVSMFDDNRGANTAHEWQQNMTTIVHEASHQVAFNTGIHSRWSPPPRWVAEGLGTMFEARGVYDSRSYPSRNDRINIGRLKEYRDYRKDRRSEDAIVELLTSDRFFNTDQSGAYAEAWALTFFLVESYPREYASYLKLTGQRQPFSDYSAKQRLVDFVSVFGKDFKMIDSRMQRFIDELPAATSHAAPAINN
jgi:hypothetical protein